MKHHFFKWKSAWGVLLLSVIVLFAVFAVRAAVLVHAYPEEHIPVSTVTGKNGENLKDIRIDGDGKLYAETTSGSITVPYESGAPISCVRYDISALSRGNCYSYIVLDGCGLEGKTIIADGTNIIDIDGANTDEQVNSITFYPVPIRGVSFRLNAFIVNPSSHIIGLEMRKFAILASVILMFEAIVLLLRGEKRRIGHPSRVSVTIMCALAGLFGAYLIHGYFTAGWITAAFVYHLAAFLSAGAYLLLAHAPAGRRSVRTAAANVKTVISSKPEFAVIRIFILTVFDFSVIEMLYGDMFRLDHMDSIFMNLLALAIPYAVCYPVFFGRKQHYSYLIPTIFWFVVAVVNHYYFEFRSQALELSDLSMAETAKNVMGSYRLDVTEDLLFCAFGFALIVFAMVTEDHTPIPRRGGVRRLSAIGAAIALMICVWSGAPEVNLWNTNSATLHHGYILTWISFAKRTLEKPTPEGYSASEAESLLREYANDGKDASGADASAESESGADSATGSSTSSGKTSTTGSSTSSGESSAADGSSSSETVSTVPATTTNDGSPNIIVVMDEAFADLPSVYGFDTDVDDLPFIHSLEGANVRKGWMMSSVFGGTTANTEYEFLTGNSTAFLNYYSVPYTQYINSDQESLAWLLKSRGYSATAFHPFYESGYKRYKVYPLMGFDDFKSLESGLKYNSKIRTYISDESDFKDLIGIFGDGQESGKPQFIFNVTMQNHGGYNSVSPSVDVTVKPTDEDLQLSQIEEYLSLAHATDAAFKDLVDYFSTVDEPTIILMFGDHQPGVSDESLKAMGPDMFEENASVTTKEKQYTVPYVMWANFDLPEGESPEYISPNFLRTYLLQCAGIEGSAYDKFTETVREQYPAVNILGYLDNDGNWNDIGTLDSVDILLDYKRIAYYNLFDHSKVDMSLFTDP